MSESTSPQPSSVIRILVLCALAYLLVCFLWNAKAAELDKELNDYLAAAHDVCKFHGAALVAKDGKVLFEKGYGMVNIELGVPNTPEMIFQIG